MRCEYIHIPLLLLIFFFPSCGLFDTREPENPISDNQSLPPATSPTLLLDNFKNSFQAKDIQEYEKLFADSSLMFIPTQSAFARYNIVFSTWNRTVETESFRNAMSSVNSSSLPQIALTVASNIQYQSDSALYTVDYTIYLPHNRADITTQFSGKSELYISPNKNNIWKIYRWIDIETKKDSSWSELKGQFAK